MHILGISGSLRAGSGNSALLRALRDNAPPDCQIAIYDGIGALPIFNPDEEGDSTPPEARRLIEAVAGADGIIVACPEYAHGVPGGLKNALDWLVSGEAAVGKPAMLAHASPRSLFARAALREIMKTMSFDLFDGAELEIALLGRKPEEFDAILQRPETRDTMRTTFAEFQAFIRRNGET